MRSNELNGLQGTTESWVNAHSASSEVLCSPVTLSVYVAETRLSYAFPVILHLMMLGFCLGF